MTTLRADRRARRLRRPRRCCSSRRGATSGIAGLAAWAVGARRPRALPRARRRRAAARRRRPSPGSSRPSSARGSCTRYPYLLAFATLACLPVRLPVTIGYEKANLLLPALRASSPMLALALAWQLLRGDDRARASSARSRGRSPPFVFWTGLSLAWTIDLQKGSIFLAAFILPFGLLAIGFARLPWRGRWLTWLWAGLVVTGARLRRGRRVPVGHARRLLEPERDRRQRLRAVLPRQLGLLGSVDLRALPRGRDPRHARRGSCSAACAAGAVVGLYVVVVAIWIGLAFSFSQSSFVALSVGVVVAAAVAWGRRAVVGLVALGVLVGRRRRSRPRRCATRSSASRARGLNKITSGRSNLVSQGIRIAVDHPVVGIGVGGFRHAYAERTGVEGHGSRSASRRTRCRSRSPPRAGVVGLALLCWLVVAALAATLLRLGRRLHLADVARDRRRPRRDRRAQLLLRRVLRGPADVGRCSA